MSSYVLFVFITLTVFLAAYCIISICADSKPKDKKEDFFDSLLFRHRCDICGKFIKNSEVIYKTKSDYDFYECERCQIKQKKIRGEL